MKNYKSNLDRNTIGVDLGNKCSEVCVVKPDGEVKKRATVPTNKDKFRQYFKKLTPSRVVMETGTHSPWASRVVAECGHEVIVANARKVRAVYKNQKKNDKVDAEMLARIGRMDPKLLGPIQHRGESAQADLALIRSRDMLVRTRCSLVEHIRGTLKSAGERPPKCSTHCYHEKVVAHIPAPLRPALVPVVETLKQLSERIKRIDRQIESLAKKRYSETDMLKQVNGVGDLTAMAFVLTLDDPCRFDDSRSVGAFVGLCPRQNDSGDQKPQLRITKTGNGLLRRLLVGSAHYIMGPRGQDCDLRRFGVALQKRGGKNARKRAIVAVARKLSVLLHRLWVSAEAYKPLLKEELQARRDSEIIVENVPA